jgi:SAM-dependent methyltransferase
MRQSKDVAPMTAGSAGQRIVPGPDGIVCPDCGAELASDGGNLCCRQCGGKWPVVDGVPYFVEEFPYWGEIPQEQMQELNRVIAANPWKAALLDSPEETVRSAAGMILNLERANWHYLADLAPDSRVLDLGAGTGTNAHALATRFSGVVAVEPVLERIRFMQHRFRQERLDNVQLIRSSLWVLPFAPDSFDLVAMNGVLEWVPSGREGDPRELQLSALKKAHSLLRADGYIYVGIENRLTIGYLAGYRDPHCGLPFVTILPRPLAQWYARRKGQPGYRNYLYSSRGYRKLFKQAGFRDLDIYLAIPSYNHPRFLIPLNGGLFSHYSRIFNRAPAGSLRRAARNLLLRLGLLKHLEYSFVMLARK